MRYQLRLFYSKFVRNSLNEFLQVKEETENNQMATINSMNNNQLEFNLWIRINNVY